MLLAAGLILSRFVGAKSLRKGRLIGNVAGGILISTVGYAIFTLWPSNIAYYGSAILIGLGNGHMWPGMQNMIINLAPNSRRATANSTILTSWDLGMGFGILLGGVVAEHLGYFATFLTTVVAHIIGVGLFFLLTKGHYRTHALR